MEKGDTKKKLWDELVQREAGARSARFGRRVVVSMRKLRKQNRRSRYSRVR